MREHIFISYARADGDGFAQQLYSHLKKQNVEVWWDLTNINPGEHFNRSIDRGLQEARAILVLLTKGAVLSTQVESEWNEAMNHFTPIFPLLMQGCEIPRPLSVLQYIDFTQSYDPAFNELVGALYKLEEDYLDHLNQIYSAYLEAQRDAPNPDRFNDKISSLQRKIEDFKRQTKRVSKSQLQGTRTVRRKKQSRVRVVGSRPTYVAELFKDRADEQKKMYSLLMEDSTRIVSIIGRGGMGKTALAARVLSGLEQNTDGKTTVDGILYLSTRTFGVSLERLFLDCETMIGGAKAAALKRVWEDPSLEPEEKGLHLLKTLSGGFYIILLDNLEDILDDQGNPRDIGLRSLIDNFLQMKSSSRMLITSRIPLALRSELSGFDQRIYLQEGLPVADGVALLRDLDPHDRYGLKSESDELLNQFATQMHGVPRAFEVAVSILANDPFRSINDLLNDFHLKKDVAQKFVEDHYYRIDLDARQVMDAVAVFARPVTAAALGYLLKPFAPNVNIPDVVNRLLDSHILAVDRTTKTVTMHPIDRDYAYSQLPETGKYNRTQLELGAAAWYRSQQKESRDRQTIQELEPNILEFEHLLRADAYDKAMEALSVFSAHLTWGGHAGRAREMIAQLDGKLHDERALMLYYYAKGDNMVLFGDFDKSRPYLADALALASKFDDLWVEANVVSLIGAAEKGVGKVEAAVEHYLRALKLFQASGNSEEEKYCLIDTGLTYAGMGNARECFLYAHKLEEFADRSGVPLDHALAQNLFTVGYILSHNWSDAFDSSQKLLKIYKEAKKDIWVPAVQNMLGMALLGLGKLDEASNRFEIGFTHAVELERPLYASRCAFNLAWTLYRMGKPEEALSVIEKGKALSGELQALRAIKSLSGAIEALKCGDLGGEAGCLLDCARICKDDIDLWDANDIASRALMLAKTAGHYDLQMQAQTLINDLRSRLMPPE